MNNPKPDFDSLGALIEVAVRQQDQAQQLQTTINTELNRLNRSISALSQVPTSVSSEVIRNLNHEISRSVESLGNRLGEKFSNANKVAAGTTQAYMDAAEALNAKIWMWAMLAYVVGIIAVSALVWLFVYPDAHKAGQLELYNQYLNSKVDAICKRTAAKSIPECEQFRER